MELTGILEFIGIFIAIISILIGIAYYGIKEASYEDTVRSKQLAKPEATAAKLKKAVKPKAKKPDQETESKKAKSKQSSQNELSTEEEEPLVFIPDPFTNKVSSRFGSLISANNLNSKPEQQKKQPATTTNGHASGVQQTKPSLVNGQVDQKLKPKVVAKQPETTVVTNNVAAPLQQRQKENAHQEAKPVVKTVPLGTKVRYRIQKKTVFLF
jgi:hypothetical protein